MTKVFSEARPVVAVKDISLSVRDGEFVCLMGPSGCGKSTLLRMFAGLTRPTSGQILVGGVLIDAPVRETALVFQEYNRSLLPWRTAEANVALALDGQAHSQSEKREAVARALELVGLSEFAGFWPWQLSGGMQQRVAIARALVHRPKVWLMDEPLGSLDAQAKEELEDQLLALWTKFRLSVIFVTHDLDQALYLGSRIVVLSDRPAQILQTVDIDFPYPRDQVATRNSVSFGKLRAELRHLMRRP